MTMTEVANVIESGNMIGGGGGVGTGTEDEERGFPSHPNPFSSHHPGTNSTVSQEDSFGDEVRIRQQQQQQGDHEQESGRGLDMDQSMEYDENSMDSDSTIHEDETIVGRSSVDRLVPPPPPPPANDNDHDHDNSSCGSGEPGYTHPASRFQMEMICPGSESEDNLEQDGRDEEDSDLDDGKLVIDAVNPGLQGQQQQLQIGRETASHPGSGGGGGQHSNKTKSLGGDRIGCEKPMSSPSGRDSPSGQSNTILSMMMMKERSLLMNGHYHTNTSTPSHHRHHHSHHGDVDRSHHHSHHGGRSGRRTVGHSSSRTHPRDLLKSERKSQSMSPLHCDVKPDSLAGTSSLTNIGNLNTSIGNALLNLASLGSLAALQQSIPNLVSSGTLNHLQQQQQQQQHGSNNNNSQLSSSSSNPTVAAAASTSMVNATGGNHHLHLINNSPLNLTNANNGGGGNNNNSSSSNNHPALASSQLAQFISQQQQNNNFLSSNLGNNSSSSSSASPMPQLILASGSIVQGIQGAQLLIPTSQGLMTQTILTIPLNQPGSPCQSLYPPTASPHQHQHPHPHHPHGSSNNGHGGGGTSSSSSGHPHLSQSVHGHYGGHGGRGHPISPPVATVPPPASPDFSEHPSALPTPHLSLGPHPVSQQMGAHIPMIQEKSSDHHRGPLNGVRNVNGRRESNTITTNGGLSISTLCPPKMSPCSSSQDSDKLSDNDDSDQMVDGINLDEIKEFAKAFKLRRLSLGLTQTQVGQALSVTEGPAYSQSAICSALAFQFDQLARRDCSSDEALKFDRFEKLDITPKSAQKIKPVLERWMKEAEDRFKNGHQNLNDFVGMEPSKKRKRRTSFTPQALEILNTHFERNTHPSGAEITTLAHQLGYEREVIRIWFCNKRQALKNTVRMMSKGSSPM